MPLVSKVDNYMIDKNGKRYADYTEQEWCDAALDIIHKDDITALGEMETLLSRSLDMLTGLLRGNITVTDQAFTDLRGDLLIFLIQRKLR